ADHTRLRSQASTRRSSRRNIDASRAVDRAQVGSPRSARLLDSSRQCSYNSHTQAGGDAMSAIGVRELKNRLPYYLRRVKRGEETIVTERGQPVAILQSLRTVDRTSSLEARLAKLAALGVVTLPAGRGFRRAHPIRVAGPSVSRAIIEDRR